MAKIRFVGHWSKESQQDIPKGIIGFKPDKKYVKDIAKGLNKLQEYQDKKGECRELDITIEYHYKKRTLDQNALLWALHDIEVNEMNAGMAGDKSQMITREELHEQDIIQANFNRIPAKIKKEKLSELKALCKRYEIKQENNGVIFLELILGSSQMTTVQLAKLVETKFNRMAVNGVAVTNPAEIKDYWFKWRQMLNDNKIVIHDELLTAEEYKQLNPLCEATGEYIADGGGSLAHIKARGMGGNEEIWKNYSSNWLHLSDLAHIEFDNGKGRDVFLKKYPHLSYKIETALRKEYSDIEYKEKIQKPVLKKGEVYCSDCGGVYHNSNDKCPLCNGMGLF